MKCPECGYEIESQQKRAVEARWAKYRERRGVEQVKPGAFVSKGNVFVEGMRRLEEGSRRIMESRKCEHGYVRGWCIRGCKEEEA